MRVNVVCRNLSDDRVIPRFSRYLRDVNGWSLTSGPDYGADAIYLSGYFEVQMCKRGWPKRPVAAYFTHREAEGDGKAKLFDRVATQVQLRVATARMYADYLTQFGETVQIRPPVERDRFVIPKSASRRSAVVAGFSGYSYRSGRKGGDLALAVVKASAGVEWRASGRGWPVQTKRYNWREMPSFFQGLDILVVTSLIEGVPMPPLEALSCGVSVVVPRGVGLLDELPNVLGIHRYKRGDVGSLVKAFGKAVKARPGVDRAALRAVTIPYTIKNWCAEHKRMMEALVDGSLDGPNAGLENDSVEAIEPMKKVKGMRPVERGTGSTRGIYCVAFGDPARTCALRMMKSAKHFMPEIPICLCSDRKIGPEDVLVTQKDTDIGGRRAKLRAYELSPAEWEQVLYLDADTKVVGDIRFYFQLIEDGWEFVICKDPHLMDTMHAFRRKGNLAELEETAARIHTMHTLQYNGGVWAFGRNERIARFFTRWLKEWDRHAQRDQGALIRAMYTEPLRVYLLGNEWNTFPKYTKGIKTAGLMHYPGDARRWRGMIPGRIDSETAWAAVRRFEQRGRR
jgi:hypothetical protein